MIIILTCLIVLYDMKMVGVKASEAHVHHDNCDGDGEIRGLFGSIFARKARLFLFRLITTGTATLTGERAHIPCPSLSSCTPTSTGEGLSVWSEEIAVLVGWRTH